MQSDNRRTYHFNLYREGRHGDDASGVRNCLLASCYYIVFYIANFVVAFQRITMGLYNSFRYLA